MPIKVTLDTNLLIEYWQKREKQKYTKILIELNSEGKIDLAITSRIEEDIPSPPLSKMIGDLPKLGIEETGSVTRLGLCKLGEDKLGSDEFVKFTGEVANLPNAPKIDWRDWDHIHAHYLQERDVFLTWDKRILSVAKDLDVQFFIQVMKPEEFIKSQNF